MLEIYFLLGIMIIGAILAIEIRSLLSSVILVGLTGFALCILFLLLQAPDVAITQLIVEVVILVILVRTTGVRQDLTEHLSNLKEWFVYLTIFVFIAWFAYFSISQLNFLPPFGHPLPTASTEIINTALAKTGSPNVVAAILLDFRVYDTLGILAVIFCAVLGVQAVLRKKGRKALNERDVFDS